MVGRGGLKVIRSASGLRPQARPSPFGTGWPAWLYPQRWSLTGLAPEGRVGAGGGVDRGEAVVKPTGMYSRRPPPDATRPGKTEN